MGERGGYGRFVWESCKGICLRMPPLFFAVFLFGSTPPLVSLQRQAVPAKKREERLRGRSGRSAVVIADGVGGGGGGG